MTFVTDTFSLGPPFVLEIEMEDAEEEILHEEKESLPPQKNNLLNYFARKQTPQVKGPKSDPQKAKDDPEKKVAQKGLKHPSEKRAPEKSSTCDLGGMGDVKLLPDKNRNDEVEEKYPKKRKRRKRDDEVGLDEEEQPQKKKRELTKAESTAIAVAQLIQLSEDEESEKGTVKNCDKKPKIKLNHSVF